MPTIAEVLSQGWMLHQSGKLNEAETVYRHVIGQAPRNPEAHVYLGIALFDRRSFQESIESYEEAIRLRDQFPIAWNNLGNSLRMIGDIERSDECFDKALAQDPKYLSVFKNRGTLWVWSGEIEKGLNWYEKGLEVAPEDPELHRNLGVIYLLLGDYDRGWPEYRWRWKMPGMHRPKSRAPLWTGQALDGKSILLYSEQGRGDEIHFIRMASTLATAGAHVTVLADPEMIPLFTSARGIHSLLPVGSALPPTDFQASLFDAVDSWYQSHAELPFAEDAFIEHNGFHGYLNVSDPLVTYWQHWMEKNGMGRDDRKRVGIAWQGNPKHHADVYRSIDLEAFRPLAEDPQLHLVSLQFGFGSEQLNAVDFGDSISQLPEDTDTSGGAFTDTAAVMKNLDHVVTTDTSVVHLAGSLGVPTTLLLGKVPDWRWLRDGETTPWYPSLRLLRQRKMGDWTDVIQRAREGLSETS